MKYTIKAHPTQYNDVSFRSRLEARWAAFFDLAGWIWEYEPIDLEGWSPDFRVEFACDHSECSGSHALLVEVKPYFALKEFEGHRCLDFPYGDGIPADASAAFGGNTDVTSWEMVHGHGSGIYQVRDWVQNAKFLWKRAGRAVQYLPRDSS